MSTRLSNIRNLGRYKEIASGKEYNIKKGTNKQRSTDHYFYLYRGKRQFITQADFHGGKYVRLPILDMSGSTSNL